MIPVLSQERLALQKPGRIAGKMREQVLGRNPGGFPGKSLGWLPGANPGALISGICGVDWPDAACEACSSTGRAETALGLNDSGIVLFP